MSLPLLDIHNLTSRYGERVALSGLSLALQPGELTVLLGPNGAGKSTLFQMLTGLFAVEPLPMSAGQSVISTAPIEGMLHRKNTLDTLGATGLRSCARPGCDSNLLAGHSRHHSLTIHLTFSSVLLRSTMTTAPNKSQSSLAMVYDREMRLMRLLLAAPLQRAWILLSKLVARLMAAYQAAVLAKDADAFMALYDAKVRVFDTWGVWSYEGLATWRSAVESWFTSLGSERVRVTFADVQTTGSPKLATLSAVVTYAGMSANGEPLRSMQNRISWVLGTSGHVLRVIHEHTSVPVGFEDNLGMLQRQK